MELSGLTGRHSTESGGRAFVHSTKARVRECHTLDASAKSLVRANNFEKNEYKKKMEGEKSFDSHLAIKPGPIDLILCFVHLPSSCTAHLGSQHQTQTESQCHWLHEI